MIKKWLSKIKEVMHRMGLIKGIEQVTDISIVETTEMYNAILKWKAQYQGYYKDWHDIPAYSINKPAGRRTMMSMQMPKHVSQELANLVFNEKVTISIDNEAFGNEIETILQENNFYERMMIELEKMNAMGGLVIKPFFKNGKIEFSFVTADLFVPLGSNSKGEITEGIFLDETQANNKYYTLLEWHKLEADGTYTVSNQLFSSDTKETIGVKVSLETLYPGLEENVTISDISRPLFVYIKPNLANFIDLNSPLGVSIFAGAQDTLHALDCAFDSFHREFKLGKKRIIVPATALKSVIDDDGNFFRYYDANDEVLEAFDFDSTMNEPKDISMTLRVEEHISAMNVLLDTLSMQVGFSPGTFTFESSGLKTATEIVSENSKTYRTRQGHVLIVEQGIKDLIEVIGTLGALYDLFTVPESYEVSVNFDDAVAEDRNSNADYWIRLKDAKIISSVYCMQKVLKITEEEAKIMLEEIQAESASNFINNMGSTLFELDANRSEPIASNETESDTSAEVDA